MGNPQKQRKVFRMKYTPPLRVCLYASPSSDIDDKYYMRGPLYHNLWMVCEQKMDGNNE